MNLLSSVGAGALYPATAARQMPVAMLANKNLSSQTAYTPSAAAGTFQVSGETVGGEADGSQASVAILRDGSVASLQTATSNMAAGMVAVPSMQSGKATQEYKETLSRSAATSGAPTENVTPTMTDSKRQAAAITQDHTQAYEEYAKAWGGRVVHGEIELPPFSIYVE